MTKTKNTPSVTEINEQIAALGNEIDTAALEGVAKQRALSMLEAIELSNDPIEKAKANAELTPELLEDRIDTVMVNAFDAFFSPEQRIEATNGKHYPIDYDFTRSSGAGRDPVEPTDNIVVVDKYGFISKQVARSICSGLEMVLRNQVQAAERQREKIAKEIRFGRNAGVDVLDRVGRMANFLESMVEQEALIRVALGRASEVYNQLTGDSYATREERDALADARTENVKGNALGEYLAKLGVTLD